MQVTLVKLCAKKSKLGGFIIYFPRREKKCILPTLPCSDMAELCHAKCAKKTPSLLFRVLVLASFPPF